jgi:hypothetical protein
MLIGAEPHWLAPERRLHRAFEMHVPAFREPDDDDLIARLLLGAHLVCWGLGTRVPISAEYSKAMPSSPTIVRAKMPSTLISFFNTGRPLRGD